MYFNTFSSCFAQVLCGDSFEAGKLSLEALNGIPKLSAQEAIQKVLFGGLSFFGCCEFLSLSAIRHFFKLAFGTAVSTTMLEESNFRQLQYIRNTGLF